MMGHVHSKRNTRVFLTLLLVSLMLSPMSAVSGSSVWKQSSDIDFNTGTLSVDTQIEGMGDSAYLGLRLNLSTGLMGEWLFEESGGTSVIDTSGKGRNGTETNAVRTAGRYGKALDYNGASSYVDLPDDLWSVNMTLEAWVYIRDFGSSDPNYSGKGIFFKAQDTGYARDFTLMAVNENNVKGVNFWFGNNATQYITLYYNGLSTNTWYHMAVTRGGGSAIIYINGAQAATKSYSFVPVDHHQDLRLGTSVNPSFQSFDGKIDEARIYDRVLSAQEIAAQYNGYVDGTYLSEPKDLGGAVQFGNLHLNSTVPANTTVQVQLRTAKTLNDLYTATFYGPVGTVGSYYSTEGQRIWAGHNGDEWVQYRAELTSNWYEVSPRFNEIRIDYDFPQNVTLLSPVGTETWTGHHNITWAASDREGDSLLFDLYLSSDSGATYPLLIKSGLANPVRTFDWDTTNITNGTHYRIKVVARDPSSEFPINVSSTSGADFTIHHPGPIPPPPPNHPPVVPRPPDGAVLHGDVYEQSVNATDADGDMLTYEFTGPGNISKPLPNMMAWGTEPFSVGNYTLTVTVSDGKDKTSVSWKVEVKKKVIIPPPPNSLPKVTLLTPGNATTVPGLTVRLQWNGTDADGDVLIYFVKLDSYNGRTTVSKQSGTEYEAQGLQYNTTYFWTVVPNDGKTNGTDLSGIWSFRTPAPHAPLPPSCKILTPIAGPTYHGNVLVGGIAGSGGPALVRVEVSLDGGAWITAQGTTSWSYSLNSRPLTNDLHEIRARSYDGKQYSNISKVDIEVYNAPPIKIDTHTTVEGPNCLMLMGVGAVVIIAGAYVSYHMGRRKS